MHCRRITVLKYLDPSIKLGRVKLNEIEETIEIRWCRNRRGTKCCLHGVTVGRNSGGKDPSISDWVVWLSAKRSCGVLNGTTNYGQTERQKYPDPTGTPLVTPVPAFVGKALLPEVALGAMTSGTLSSTTIDDLCSGIILMATQHMERGGAMSGLNISQLLRALSRRPHGTNAMHLTQLLLWRFLEDHKSFTVLDLVSAVHVAVTM